MVGLLNFGGPCAVLGEGTPRALESGSLSRPSPPLVSAPGPVRIQTRGGGRWLRRWVRGGGGGHVAPRQPESFSSPTSECSLGRRGHGQ